MEICPVCFCETLTTHAEQGIAVCQGCSPAFCTECYHGARYSCAYFHDTSDPPEENWRDAEMYLGRNPDKSERVVRSGPKIRCAVVRVEGKLFRRTVRDGVVVKDLPVDPIEACVYCGAYDRTYTAYIAAYRDGFACTECANGILGRM